MSLLEAFERYLPLIETELHEVVQPADHELGIYYGMMQYHLGWLDEHMAPSQAPQGKRLRPLLCLLACEAVGGSAEHALPAADYLNELRLPAM